MTVENPLTLPRVVADADAVQRPVLAVTTAPSGFEGRGFRCAARSPGSTTSTWTRSS
ncbi:hypothetical protein ACFQVA_20845 [Actinomadura keratinilytica]